MCQRRRSISKIHNVETQKRELQSISVGPIALDGLIVLVDSQ